MKNVSLFVIVLSLLGLPDMASAARRENAVDITGLSEPCGAIQSALDSIQKGGPGLHRLTIKGSARIGFEDLQDRGDYRLCFGLLPSEPMVREGKKRDLLMIPESVMLGIHFDDVDIVFDPSGQTEPVVLAQWGDFYQRGWESAKGGFAIDGYIEGGQRLSGRLALRTAKKLSGDWPRGKIPGLPFGGKTSSPTTVVGWFETGMLRTDASQLSLTLLGSRNDADDIGLIHQHGWGIYRGFIRATNWGVGLLFYGNSVGNISEGYVSQNTIGISLGDPWIGGDVQPSPNCARGILKKNQGHCERRNQSIKETALRDMVVEGNTYGNLLVFDGERLKFDSLHFESGKPASQKGHSVLIGAGSCSAKSPRAGLPCGADPDCKVGRCTAPPNARARSIRFSGGSIGSDRFSNEWDSLFLGPGAIGKNSAESLILSTNVLLSDVDRTANMTDRCGTPGVRCELFGHNPKASLIVDATDCHFHRAALARQRYRKLMLSE